jgi:hypothetical protein
MSTQPKALRRFDAARAQIAPSRNLTLAALAALVAGLLSWCIAPALADGATPGLLTGAPLAQPGLAAHPAEPLSPYATFSGEHLSLSVDALGTNEAEGPIQVQKNDPGATVRAAYLFAASTGGSGYVPANGDVTLDGTPVEWEEEHTIESDIGSANAVANVTSIVKPVVDPAPSGLVQFTVAEGAHAFAYDGEILVVLLEDPSVHEARSVTLLYGAQNPLGDTFHVGLAEPVDKSNPAFALNLSLGISFGYQAAEFETGQFSTVKVNEKLMTTSAGGQDDCVNKYKSEPEFPACGNGELITAGGIGDSIENPPNPEATPTECVNAAGLKSPRCDDELYSLLPFLENGESAITFNTTNPSDNDNIFFAALEVRGGAAVVGEGVTLSPTAGVNKVGESHTLTAAVQNEHGEPIEGAAVQFQVTSGPNAGVAGSAVTGAGGRATFAYSSSKAGIDHIVASFTNDAGIRHESNEVSETWEAAAATQTPATTTTTTSTTTTTTSKPAGGVLGFGAAHAASAPACLARSGYLASVSGKAIASVTFKLDGHTVATVRKPNSHGAFTARVNVRSGAKHHLTMHVSFTAASHTAALNINRTLARCAAHVHTAPRFTG